LEFEFLSIGKEFFNNNFLLMINVGDLNLKGRSMILLAGGSRCVLFPIWLGYALTGEGQPGFWILNLFFLRLTIRFGLLWLIDRRLEADRREMR
jgi:hypothetical protein